MARGGPVATPAHGRPEKASDEDMAETADGTEGDGASSTTGGGPTRPQALAEDQASFLYIYILEDPPGKGWVGVFGAWGGSRVGTLRM